MKKTVNRVPSVKKRTKERTSGITAGGASLCPKNQYSAQTVRTTTANESVAVHYFTSLNARQLLCPPNPKELLSAGSITAVVHAKPFASK